MPRKIIILNQAANYLTIGFANAFKAQFEEVVLLTGSIHTQGEELCNDIHIEYINHWNERPAFKKLFSFALALINMWWLLMTRYRNYEVFFVSVPPMGYLLNLILPHRFSMVIWDVYPDVFKITGMRENHPLYRIWAKLNRWSFDSAHRLFTISDRMADLIAQYVNRDKIIVQPIWSIFQKNIRVGKAVNPFIQAHSLEGKFIVQYSGNIGLTHKVEALVALAERMTNYPRILFQIIGRGPRKPVLEKLVAEKGLDNCVFLPFQSDEMFPYSLSAADVGVVILDELTAKGSVPSKSYNLMSFGIPSLYIASEDSQLKLYVDKYQHGACFQEHELDAMCDFILTLSTAAPRYARLSQNAEKASLDFRRENADKFVARYLAPKGQTASQRLVSKT